MLLNPREVLVAVVMSACFLFNGSEVTLASTPTTTSVNLTAVANVEAIARNGSAVAHGGVDTHGNAYSSSLMGAALTWSDATFTLGETGGLDAVSSQTIPLPAGHYSTLKLLATGCDGDQPDQSFIVTYSDGTTSTITQGLSDWRTPQDYAGESTAVTYAYRVTETGALHYNKYHVYGYSFAINSSKTVHSLTLPNNRHVVVLSVGLTANRTATSPTVPANFTARAGNAQVGLGWTASSGATGYHVKRATTSGGPYTQVGTPSSTSYTDASLSNGTTYYYVVSALDSAGESANSAQASAMPAAAVAIATAPTGLAASAGNAQVSLGWTASSGATGYHVKRATTSGGPYTQVGAPSSTSYTDASLSNGTTYYYVVSALDSAGESANSAGASATPVAAGTQPVITSVSVTPSNTFIVPGGTEQFSAIALDQNAKAQPSLSWTANGGSISASGLYTAPTTAGTYSITAKSAASTVTGSTTVTVAAVSACTSVPAPGNWDTASVSPVTPSAGEPSYEWNGKTMAIVVDPFVPSTVWLGTGSDGLYKSTSCGAPGSWVKVDTGANHAVLDSGNIWSMAVDPDPSRQGVIYALVSYGSNNGIWKSVNGGVDWTQLQVGNNSTLASSFWNNVSMDASNTLHIAVTSHGTTAVSGYTNGAIAESFDGGNSWPNIVATPAAWGEQGGINLIPGTIGSGGANTSTWLWGTGDNQAGTYLTTNSGAAWSGVLSGYDSSIAENNILPLQKASNGNYYVPAIAALIKSSDGIHWSQSWGQNRNFQNPSPVGIAITASTIYAGSAMTLYSAPLSNDSNWTVMPSPPALSSSDSIGFMAYDKAHGILYISTWWSVFRYNVPSSSR